MIILDSCTVRSFNLQDSSADVLRTLATFGERVAIPWMVAEELLAQRVIAYQDAHAAATAALDAVTRLTPWKMEAHLDDSDVDRVLKHWQKEYGTVAETLPVSPAVMSEALAREAYVLAPCKKQDKIKTGARDAAIWLTAVEYARQHPDEAVYFVSNNTKDFTDGSGPYPAPMDQDVADLGDRFIHLTALAQVIERFMKHAKADKSLAGAILGSEVVLKAVANAAQIRLSHGNEGFPCTTSAGDVAQEVAVSPACGWFSATVKLHTVKKVQAYRIGEHEWYTAVAVWHISGKAYLDLDELSIGGAGAAWTTSVLFKPDADDPRVTILRFDLPCPLSAEEFAALGLTGQGILPLGPVLEIIQDHISEFDPRPRGLRRAYEGALVKQVRQSAVERRLDQLLRHNDG